MSVCVQDADNLLAAMKKRIEDAFREMDNPQFVEMDPYSKPQLHEAFAGSPEDGQ